MSCASRFSTWPEGWRVIRRSSRSIPAGIISHPVEDECRTLKPEYVGLAIVNIMLEELPVHHYDRFYITLRGHTLHECCTSFHYQMRCNYRFHTEPEATEFYFKLIAWQSKVGLLVFEDLERLGFRIAHKSCQGGVS